MNISTLTIKTTAPIVKQTAANVSNIYVNNNALRNASGMTAPAINLVPDFVKTGYDKFIGYIAKGVGKIANMESVQKVTRYCVKNDVNYTQHLAAACANVLNGFYMYNVSRSKKIEEEQKGPLMLNMFIGTVFSTAGGYLLDGTITKKLKPIEDAIEKNFDKSKASGIKNGYRIAKSLMVFQLLYRFVSPVIATPIANHISNKIREKKEGDKGNLTV